jgi:hypothetical protein
VIRNGGSSLRKFLNSFSKCISKMSEVTKVGLHLLIAAGGRDRSPVLHLAPSSRGFPSREAK